MRNVEFTPVFMYRDEQEIKREKKKIQKGAEHLNEFVNMVISRLNWKPTNDDKIFLKDMGIDYIHERLKKNFPFKNASIEFNLEALGINLKPLENCYSNYFRYWQGYDYAVNENGLFEPKDLNDYPEITRHIHYTRNQKQNIALKLAKKLEALFLQLDKKGLLLKYSLTSISDVTNLLEYAYDENKNLRIIPDYHSIARIK